MVKYEKLAVTAVCFNLAERKPLLKTNQIDEQPADGEPGNSCQNTTSCMIRFTASHVVPYPATRILSHFLPECQY